MSIFIPFSFCATYCTLSRRKGKSHGKKERRESSTSANLFENGTRVYTNDKNLVIGKRIPWYREEAKLRRASLLWQNEKHDFTWRLRYQTGRQMQWLRQLLQHYQSCPMRQLSPLPVTEEPSSLTGQQLKSN